MAVVEFVDYFEFVVASQKCYSWCFALRSILILRERELNAGCYCFTAKQVLSLVEKLLIAKFAAAIIAEFEMEAGFLFDFDKSFTMFVKGPSEQVIEVYSKVQHYL